MSEQLRPELHQGFRRSVTSRFQSDSPLSFILALSELSELLFLERTREIFIGVVPERARKLSPSASSSGEIFQISLRLSPSLPLAIMMPSRNKFRSRAIPGRRAELFFSAMTLEKRSPSSSPDRTWSRPRCPCFGAARRLKERTDGGTTGGANEKEAERGRSGGRKKVQQRAVCSFFIKRRLHSPLTSLRVSDSAR